MTNPQSEVAVWLQGMGEPIDVTRRQTTACCEPFLICIGFDEGNAPGEREVDRLFLEFWERAGGKRLLGRIGLDLHSTESVDRLTLFFFHARSSRNYCLPGVRLCAHYLVHAYKSWETANTSGLEMTFLERRAAMVTFIRAHPVCLVTANDECGGNIFPMNLMGELGCGRLGFALKRNRTAAPLLERTRKLAVSSVPTNYAPLVFRYAAHHFQESIDWGGLPFAMGRSQTLAIPVPEFALRVRELEVEKIYRNGSHTFFVAKIVSDERLADEEELCAIHGFYQAWRLRGQSVQLRASVERHRLHKKGPVPLFRQAADLNAEIEAAAHSVQRIDRASA